MNAESFRETVETAKQTQLKRLGSSKLLLALTEADLSKSAVLRAAAYSEHAACETFRVWAADETNGRASAAFEKTARQEDEHLQRVLDAAEEDIDLPDGAGPMHAYLRGRDDTIERIAAGMVGRGLVSIRTHTQVIGFFVNEADRANADLFRELKAETVETLSTGLELLDELCEDDGDWERARMVAEYVVQVAYDDYADGLAELGVDPKPLC
ncbi:MULTISPECIES: rubrerythrin family protein [Haloferax]|uniref:Rubrerythrin family protein n=1 Tax=Haloferax marinum TaxID=2666143 RepID=A0A6A8G587_9EURY|nr:MULTISPECIES: rubrerythrin family protein [Haloferax]KAB1196297.1 rubrerythrin family protein [Haloferax sp. CBA1150]MRW95286.1 rubrerythrin family protein [Haloferax marinum]